MRKYFALFLAIILLALIGCSNGEITEDPNNADTNISDDGGSTNEEPAPTPDYMKHEKTDKTSLSLENSKISFSAISENNQNMGLDVTVTDGESSVLLDDVMFVLERKISNGVGTTVLEPIYDEATTNVRIGTKLAYTVTNNGVELSHSSKSTAIRFVDYFHFDNTKDYAIIVDLDDLVLGTVDDEANTPGWEIYGTIKYDNIGNWDKKSSSITWMPDPRFTEEGRIAFYLSDDFRNHLYEADVDYTTQDVAISLALYVRGNGTALTLKEFSIIESEKGFKTADNKASVTCFTDGFESSLTYPNGTKVEAFDYYSNEYTVARKLTLTENGLISVGGKVDGKVSYDGKNHTVTAEYNGVEYAIVSSRKQVIEFFDSEEDLYAGNGTTEPTENTKYWVAHCPDLRVGESVYMAVSADTAGTDIDLVETAKYAIDAFYRIEK